MSLYELSAKYQQAFLSLADSDYDELTINDTLDGLEGELVAKSQNVLAYALNLDAEATALKELEAKIAKRRKAKESQSQAMREYLKRNMAACGITEIRAHDNSFIAKLYVGRDVAVVIDGDVPNEFCRYVPASYTPDKALLRKAIEEGIEVNAHLDKRDRLEIK